VRRRWWAAPRQASPPPSLAHPTTIPAASPSVSHYWHSDASSDGGEKPVGPWLPSSAQPPDTDFLHGFHGHRRFHNMRVAGDGGRGGRRGKRSPEPGPGAARPRGRTHVCHGCRCSPSSSDLSLHQHRSGGLSVSSPKVMLPPIGPQVLSVLGFSVCSPFEVLTSDWLLGLSLCCDLQPVLP